MGSLNRVTLLGNLGRDPEVRATPTGQSVVNFRIATNDGFVDKSGERKEETEWHRIVVWGKPAEACGKYLKQGSTVMVEGRLQTRSYKRDGVDVFTTEVVAHNVQFVSRGKGRDSEATEGAGPLEDPSGPPPGARVA